VCYRGIGDEPDVLCRDLPPNRLRFVGSWFLTPERHFWEWSAFILVGFTVLVTLVPKLTPKFPSGRSAGLNALLAPRHWMKGCSIVFYPYVAYTKLSWPGSYYPQRWLMFVGMPVGTFWLLSVIFCFSDIFWGRCIGARNSRSSSDDEIWRYTVRFWLLEIWFSSLPMLVVMLPGLFSDAMFNVLTYANGITVRSGHNGDNASIAYFCHGFFLVLTPIYYFFIRELPSSPPPSLVPRQIYNRIWTFALETALRQLAGTAILVIYYMGIVTLVAIEAGMNVNSLLVERYNGEGSNFRIYCVMGWLWQGWAIRCFLGGVKFVFEMLWLWLFSDTDTDTDDDHDNRIGIDIGSDNRGKNQ